MSDPYYGLFRLWNLYELNSPLLINRQKLGQVSVNDLVIDTDNFTYYLVIGTNPLTYVPWVIDTNVSDSSLVRVDNRVANFPSAWEDCRLLVTHDNRAYLSKPIESNLKAVSHIKIYRDRDLREVISKNNVTDDSIEYGDSLQLMQKVYSGETVFYTLWDASASLMLVMPILVERTDSLIKTYSDAPVDIRLVSRFINPSDPRVIDLTDTSYQTERDFITLITYANGQTEYLRLEDDRVDIIGLDNLYYSELGYHRVTLLYRYTDDQTAWLTREYVVLVSEVQLPAIEELPEPPRVDVYLTSTNYDLTIAEENTIEDSALIVGSAIAREVIFSTSTLYPKDNFDTFNQDYELTSTRVSFIAPPVDTAVDNWGFELLAPGAEIRNLRITHSNPTDTAVDNWGFELLAPGAVLRDLRITHSNPTDTAVDNWGFELLAPGAEIRNLRITHSNPTDTAVDNWGFELLATGAVFGES